MKKLYTFLLVTIVASSSFAQQYSEFEIAKSKKYVDASWAGIDESCKDLIEELFNGRKLMAVYITSPKAEYFVLEIHTEIALWPDPVRMKIFKIRGDSPVAVDGTKISQFMCSDHQLYEVAEIIRVPDHYEIKRTGGKLNVLSFTKTSEDSKSSPVADTKIPCNPHDGMGCDDEGKTNYSIDVNDERE